MSRYNRLKQPRSNALSIRSLVLLFVATLTVSLLLLMILFNLVFKNIDLNFRTKMPEAAPQPDGVAGEMARDAVQRSDGQARFEQEGVMTARINVPGRRAYSPPVATPTAMADTSSDTDGADDAALTSTSDEGDHDSVPAPVAVKPMPPRVPLTGPTPSMAPPPPGMSNPATAPTSPQGR